MKHKFLKCLFFLILPLITFWVYRESFTNYYFQDDWYSLTISRVNDPLDFIKLFLPNPLVVYYRPLGMQVPFFLNLFFFGPNPLPFRYITFSVHIVNSILVYLLFKRLLKSATSSFLSSFLYATSAIHYIPFFWSATFAFVLGPTFALLTFIFYLDNKYKKSFLFFILGLFTFEIIAVVPLIIAVHHFIFRPHKKHNFLLPFLFLSAFYLLFRSIFLPPPEIPDYRFSLNQETVQNLKYYLLWSFNWPEEMKNQFVKFFTVNRLFIRDFKTSYRVFVVSFFINLFFLLVLPVCLALFKKIKIDLRIALFSLIWYICGLLPVIFFPRHAFPYYLPFSFIGLLLFFLSLYSCFLNFLSKKNVWAVLLIHLVLVINWMFSVSTLIDFNSKIHWAPRRGRLSAQLTTSARQIHALNNKASVFLAKDDPEIRLALNDQDALRIIFDNPEIKTVYTNQNSDGIKL